MASKYATVDPKTGKIVGGSSGNAWQTAADKANAANEKRYEEAKGIYQGIAETYAPGGTFGQGALATFERQKTRDISSASQSLVDSGLYNTTVTAGLDKKYEEEVGNPFRLNLEDVRMQRYGEAQAGLAGLVERRTDQAPDPNLYANLQQGASSGGGQSYTDKFGSDSGIGKSSGSYYSAPQSSSGSNYRQPMGSLASDFTPMRNTPTPQVEKATAESSVGIPLTYAQSYMYNQGAGPRTDAAAQEMIKKKQAASWDETFNPFQSSYYKS